MNETVFVTGGAGFIGSYYVRMFLRDADPRIVNIDKLTYAAVPESLDGIADQSRYRFVNADISDVELLGKLLTQERPCGIVHFAAETHVDRSIDAPDTFARTNVMGTLAILKACSGYWQGLSSAHKSRFRFLHVSTDEVYGSADAGSEFDEYSRIAPSSPYAASKAAAECFCHSFYATYDLPILQTRCSNNFGPYQFPEKLIPLVTLNAVERKPLPIYGNGEQMRDWLYVEDHCSAVLSIFKRGTPGNVYNIASGTRRRNIDVVREICKIVDQELGNSEQTSCESLIEFVADRPGHDICYAIDSAKVKAELGWRPTYEFSAALRETVRWYLHNRHWVSRVNQRYQRTRLGLTGLQS